jgi:hypothetical protein
MTDPQYVNELAALYTRMHNHPGEERPLTEKFGPPTKPNREVVSDDEPKWKKLLRKSYQDKKDAVVADVPKEAEECEEENSKSLTLNEEEINVVQEALLRLEPESFWREGGPKDEFYSEEEVNRMLYIAQDILKRSGVE